MIYKYYEVGEGGKGIKELGAIRKGSVLEQVQTEIGALGDDATDSELIIFLANTKEFWKLRVIYELFEKNRILATVSVNENISVKGSISDVPILTLFSSDSFENEKEKRNFGMKYWDSSIWQRWVDVGPLKNRTQADEIAYRERLRSALMQIQWNMNFSWHDEKDATKKTQNIYKSDIAAKEFSEFSSRLYKNSFVANLNQFETSTASDIRLTTPEIIGGHAGEVTPFPFFEETEFRKNFLNHNLATGTSLNDLKWRILLIDDKTERLEQIKALFKSPEFGSKFQILENEEDSHDKPALFFHHVKKFADVEHALTKSHYDIILLDYLLDQQTDDQNKDKRSRNFSLDLFPNKHSKQDVKAVLENEEIKRGPTNKLWFFLTSCYSSAFLDGLRERGISMNEENWIINRGADPVNTPCAFMYTFTRFLEFQINTFTGGGKQSSEIWESSLKDLKKFSRDWANRTLSKILNYANNIESLRALSEHKSGRSLFAFSFLQSEWYKKQIASKHESGWYGYLTHLLFMLTSGDGNRWEEIKTDLDFIRQQDDFSDVEAGYAAIQERIETLRNLYGS